MHEYDNMYIYCLTDEDATSLLEHLDSKGYTWVDGESLTQDNRWYIYGSDTVYYINPHGIRYGSACHPSFDKYSPMDIHEIIGHRYLSPEEIYAGLLKEE